MSDERSATSIDGRIGQRVRARRLEIGMSQERLAELCGVTFQQIQKYEKGKNRIACSRLHDVAGALGMEPGEFFVGLGAKAKGAAHNPRETALATPEGARLLTVFAAIKSVRVRRRVVELIETMADETREANP